MSELQKYANFDLIGGQFKQAKQEYSNPAQCVTLAPSGSDRRGFLCFWGELCGGARQGTTVTRWQLGGW